MVLAEYFPRATEESLTVAMVIELEPLGTGAAGTIIFPIGSPEGMAPARRPL
jgi:hypothetical protein